MVRNKTGNNQFLKELNKTVVLDLIREQGAISKIRLSELTGLSPTAVGAISTALQEEGYIHETGAGQSKGGRRPILLQLKKGSFYSVGVDFDVDYMSLALVDITGDVLGQKSCRVSRWDSCEKVIDKMEGMIGEAVADYTGSGQKLLGIGLSIPGLVDCENARVIMAPNLGWRDVNILSGMKKYGNVPVYMENEAMASAVYENWIGSCRGVDNFACINIESGIGAGIFVNGKPYRGAGGTAGEIGHIVVDENGPKCGCDNYGCLETMASARYIEQRARKLVRQGVSSGLNKNENPDSITIDDVIKAAREGDHAAEAILQESARYLGIGVAGMVNMLNPSHIVIGKEFTKYADLVLDTVRAVVERKALKSPASVVKITASAIGDRASTIGAALIPVKTLFGK